MRAAEPEQLLAQHLVPVGLQWPVALGGAVLRDQLARPPLRAAEHPLQMFDRAAPAAGLTSFSAQLLERLDLEFLVGHDPVGSVNSFMQPLVLMEEPAKQVASMNVGALIRADNHHRGRRVRWPQP
jgi:hypothetical protein